MVSTKAPPFSTRSFPASAKPGKLKDGEAVLTNEITLGFDYGPYVEPASTALTSCPLSGWPKTAEAGRRKPDPAALAAALEDPKAKSRSCLVRVSRLSLGCLTRTRAHRRSRVGSVLRAFISGDGAVPQGQQGCLSMVLGNAGKERCDERRSPRGAARHRRGCDGPHVAVFQPAAQQVGSSGLVRMESRSRGCCRAPTTRRPVTTLSQSRPVHHLGALLPRLVSTTTTGPRRTVTTFSRRALRTGRQTRQSAAPVDLGDGTEVQAIFSPSSEVRSKPKVEKGQRTFPLLEMAASTAKVKEGVLLKAKQGVYFPAYPGAPSFLDVATWLQKKKPHLYIRGAVSSAQALPKAARGYRGRRVSGYPAGSPVGSQWAQLVAGRRSPDRNR